MCVCIYIYIYIYIYIHRQLRNILEHFRRAPRGRGGPTRRAPWPPPARRGARAARRPPQARFQPPPQSAYGARLPLMPFPAVERVFITQVKGTFFGR